MISLMPRSVRSMLYVTGHAFRFRHLDRALQYLADRKDVWLATSDEIADWYLDHYYEPTVDALRRRAAARRASPDEPGAP